MMNVSHAFDSAKRAAAGWVADRAASMGAALSYYTVFSIAPLLLIVIAVAGLVFGADAARGAIVGELQGLLGDDAARTIQEMLANASEPKQGTIATIVGFVLLLVGATTVFAELQDDLNRIWKVPERAKPKGLWGWIRARILSFGMILAIGFVLLVSLVASAAIAAVGQWGGGLFGAWETLAHIVEVVVSFGLLTAIFAVMYRFLPDVRIDWHDVWVGAAVTALLFAVGKFAIGMYIGKSSTASTFGAAGSLVVMLLWVYYSAQIFLFGAEFTAAYAHAYGSRRDKPQEQQGAAPGLEPQARPAVGGAKPATARPAAAPVHGTVALPGPRAAAARVAAQVPRALPDQGPPPHGVTAPIARHPMGAMGVAAGLGAAVAYGLQRTGHMPVPLKAVNPDIKDPKARQANVKAPRRGGRRTPFTPQGAAKAGKGIAKALLAGLSTLVVTALGERVKRGAKRGWHKARAA